MQILIVTHGELAAGFKDAAEVIFGEVKGITTIGLHSGESVEAFGEKIYATLAGFDENESVLIIADLLSASPYNQSVLSVNKLDEKRAENDTLNAGASYPGSWKGNQQPLGSDLEAVVNELKTIQSLMIMYGKNLSLKKQTKTTFRGYFYA